MTSSFDTNQKPNQEKFEQAAAIAKSMGQNLQAIAQESADFSKRSFQSTSSFVSKLLAAKTFENAIAIQSDFAKAQIDDFAFQAKTMSDLLKNVTQALTPAASETKLS